MTSIDSKFCVVVSGVGSFWVWNYTVFEIITRPLAQLGKTNIR